MGQWFRDRGARFDLVIAGGLKRQQITAQEIVDAMGTDAVISIDSRWSEFDLDGVYAGIGPLLARDDERFHAEYKELQRDSADPDSAAHRNWRNCDVTVVRAWIEGSYAEFEGESFTGFGARVREAFFALPRNLNVVVVTSATPIGICIGTMLELAPHKVMRLGAGFNSAFSEIDLRHSEPRLVSFNNVPHLPDPRMRTLR